MDKNGTFSEHTESLCRSHINILDSMRSAKESLIKAGHISENMSMLIGDGKLSLSDTPASPDYVRLSDTIAKLSFAEAKKVSIAIMCLMIVLEGVDIFPGIIDIGNIYYKCSGVHEKPFDYDICICRCANFELMGIAQSWYPSTDDLAFFSQHMFLPMTREMQNLAHLRLIHKILTAKSNHISDCEGSTSIAWLEGRQYIPSAENLLSEILSLEPESAEEGSQQEHYIYCFVPGETDCRDYFELLCDMRNTAGQKALCGTQVYESFIIPDAADDIIIVEHRPYDPIFTIDTPRAYRNGSSLNALVNAMLLISRSQEPVFLNVIGSASQIPNMANCRLVSVDGTSSGCRFRLYERSNSKYALRQEQIKDNRELLKFCSSIICQR